ncbi:MAG: DNA polymerase I, partial [bacterium]
MIKKKIFLIDGSSYLYRAFYAIASLSNSKGLPTNAIYGFTTMLLKLMKVEHPEYLGICFDLPAPTFRHQEFVEYKAQRKPTPEDLIVQIPWIKKVVQTMGIQTIEVAGYEADDIMGTLAKRGEQGQFQVILVTGDKDMLQLVNPNISVLRMHRGEEYLYDETKTIEKYGVPPAKFPDLVGLMGDSSDNIPGVPGIGEKTASRLIQEYGDLDTVLNHIEAIKGEKLQMQLRTYRDQAILSRRLATIQTSMDLSLTLDDLKIQPPKTDSLIALFSELEFHKLLNEIPKDQTKQVIEINYEHILTKEQISVASKAIENAESIAISLATRTDDSVDGLAVSVSNSQNFYFAWNKDTEQVIRDILVSDSIPKIGFNLKHEYINAQKNKIEFHNGIFDIMLAAYLITPEQSALTLPQLTLTYLHRQLSAVTPTDELALTSATNMQSLIGQTQAICELKTVFDKQLKEKQLQSLFQDIEMPLVKILAEMELTGITIDVDYFADLSRQFESGLSHLSHEIYQYAGEEFNINSPKQLSYILFEKLKLPVKKKTKTGYSTNVDVLEELAIQHQLPAKILEYRTLSKMKSTYVDALLQLVEPKTDLLHSSFNQAGTATGRFSSSDPNLQNLPAQGDWADKIRAGFIPRDKKNVFLSADYSQIELRILAHLSQ